MLKPLDVVHAYRVFHQHGVTLTHSHTHTLTHTHTHTLSLSLSISLSLTLSLSLSLSLSHSHSHSHSGPEHTETGLPENGIYLSSTHVGSPNPELFGYRLQSGYILTRLRIRGRVYERFSHFLT